MLCKKCGGLVEHQYEETGKCENCFADTCGNVTNIYEDKVNLEPMTEEQALALPISYLGLSEKTENRLSDKGIIFIRDLAIKTEANLKDIPNFGNITLVEIKRQLQKFGLALKNEQSQLLASSS